MTLPAIRFPLADLLNAATDDYTLEDVQGRQLFRRPDVHLLSAYVGWSEPNARHLSAWITLKIYRDEWKIESVVPPKIVAKSDGLDLIEALQPNEVTLDWAPDGAGVLGLKYDSVWKPKPPPAAKPPCAECGGAGYTVTFNLRKPCSQGCAP